MPYRQNFPIPSEIDPPRTCLCIPIPDSAEWRAVVAGLISELTHWFNYERTGTNEGALCAAVWKEIFTEIDWSNMSCCCDDVVTLYIWTEDGQLEKSTDDGVTYVPAPENDPRNNSPVYPPTPGEPSSDKKCIASTGMSLLIKEGVGDQLTEDMGRYTLAQLIKDWVGTVIETSNPFEALMQIVANQIFALLISAVIAALTETVYGILQCIFYCHISDDLTFDDEAWELVRADILSMIGGVAGLFLEHLVFLLGRVGLTNLARSQAATEGDCSDCNCDVCADLWDLLPDASIYHGGTIVSRVGNKIRMQSTNVGGTRQQIGLWTGSPSTGCCEVTYEVVSGGYTDFVDYILCGEGDIITGFLNGQCIHQILAFTDTTGVFVIEFEFHPCT